MIKWIGQKVIDFSGKLLENEIRVTQTTRKELSNMSYIEKKSSRLRWMHTRMENLLR